MKFNYMSIFYIYEITLYLKCFMKLHKYEIITGISIVTSVYLNLYFVQIEQKSTIIKIELVDLNCLEQLYNNID